jgi:hypothetical protein
MCDTLFLADHPARSSSRRSTPFAGQGRPVDYAGPGRTWLGKLGSLALAALAVSAASQVGAQMQSPTRSSSATTQATSPLGTIQVPSQKVQGPYPPQPPHMGKDVNSGAPPVPTDINGPSTTAGAPPGTDTKRAPK